MKEKIVAKMMSCPSCGRMVPVERLQVVEGREHTTVARTLWFSLHLEDRSNPSDQTVCRNSKRIAGFMEGLGDGPAQAVAA